MKSVRIVEALSRGQAKRRHTQQRSTQTFAQGANVQQNKRCVEFVE